MERQAPRATPSFLFSFLSTPRKEKKSGIALAYGAANTNQRKLFFFDCLRSAGRTALFNQSHQWKQRHLLYWMVDWKRMLPLAITALVSFTIDSFHFSIVHQRLVNGGHKSFMNAAINWFRSSIFTPSISLLYSPQLLYPCTVIILSLFAHSKERQIDGIGAPAAMELICCLWLASGRAADRCFTQLSVGCALLIMGSLSQANKQRQQ